MGARPTLEDVCQEARTSIYSASRALSGLDGVSTETRERVLEAAAKLGYVANQVARNLKRNSSRTIGILTANNQNQYYATLTDSLERVAQENGFHCIASDAVVDGVYSTERENRFIASLLENRVAGVIVSHPIASPHTKQLLNWGIPILFVDCAPPKGLGPLPYITADNRLGSLEVGRHLASHGYRRWAYVAHSRQWGTRQPRERGFLEAAREAGATVAIIEAGNDAATARQAVTRFLDATQRRNWPEALYASNTPLLQGTLRSLREFNASVPSDVAIVAFDDFEWAEIIDPPITVVDQKISEIGRRAAQLMLKMVAETSAGSAFNVADFARTERVKPVLRIRGSCGCSRRQGVLQ